MPHHLHDYKRFPKVASRSLGGGQGIGWTNIVTEIRKVIASRSQRGEHMSDGPAARPNRVTPIANVNAALPQVAVPSPLPQPARTDRQHDPKIVFTGDAGTDFDHHAFQFSVYINGELKWCVIAQETVKDFFNLSGDTHFNAVWSVFQQNRNTIEAAARQSIRSIKIGPDGRIRVNLEELTAVGLPET
jgi:hypothetical protein